MATVSSNALDRITGFAFMLLLCLCLPVAAQGQGTSPLVTASFASGMSHPSGWGVIQQTALDANGDWLVVDFPNGALYAFPPGGGAAVTLVPPAGLGSIGGYQNPALLIDPANNLYVGANWNNCLMVFPWDVATQTWDGLSMLTAANPSTAVCPNSTEGTSPYIFAHYNLSGTGYPGYFQPWGVAVGNNKNMIVGAQNSGNFIFSLQVNGAWNTPTVGTVTMLLDSLKKRPISVAQDPEGNVYFVEDSNGAAGLYEIPSGTTGLADESTLSRVDPNLPSVSGVVTDAVGNLYISDSTDGVFLVPNPSGTPMTSSAVQISAVPAVGEVAIDWTRNILYVPTNQKQSNGEADVAMVTLNYAEFGASALATASPSGTINFSFQGAVTPASFAIVEGGMASPDFSISGGTCTLGTAYAAGGACSENLVMTPTTVGSISANLLMLDAKGNVLNSIALHGTGTGSTIQATPALESAVGGSLNTPSQVATDASGNIYVADAGLKQVVMYAAGSGASAAPVSIGTGLAAPTGVAVDGGGDVFIADSGNVYEVPFGPNGLNAAGQVTLVSGLGANLRLATDSLGDLYAADPANARVVKLSTLGGLGTGILAQSQVNLTSGLTAPSNVAVDSSNNLYVIDGANLFEFMGGAGSPMTLLNSLSNANSVTIDASGAVYVASTGSTVRIPLVSGSLNTADETTIATSVTSPTAIAIDRWGNVYLADMTAENVHVVSTSGSLDLGTLATPTSTATDPITITNEGNSSLTITGYTSTNATDFTAADVSCESAPVASGANCQANVTFDPGAGEQGALSGQIGFTSNSGNSSVLVDVSGVGAALAASNSSLSVGSGSEVVNTTVTVNVAAGSGGSGTPTGSVTVTFPNITGSTSTASATLTNGTATLTLAPVAAGSQKFSVNYSGDRVFGRSSQTITATIAKSAAAMAQPTTPPPFLPYVLEQDGSTPYDGSVQYWQYNYTVTIGAAVGQPTGTVTFNDNSTDTNYQGVACPQAAAGVQTVNASGQAIFPTSCLPMPQNVTYTPMVSTHTITAVYSGDSNFLSVTGPAQTFIAVRSPAVKITSSPASLTVSAGGSASANLTLTEMLGYGFAGRGGQLNDYNFPVSLTCSNLPPHTSCAIAYPNPDANIPTAVDLPCPTQVNGSAETAQEANSNCTPGAATVTLVTDVSVGTTAQLVQPATMAYAALFGFGMVGLFFRRRMGKAGRLFLMAGLAVLSGALATSLTACSTANLSPASVLTTPSGSYSVTITAVQVGSQVITLPTGPITIYGSQNQVSLPFTLNVTVQ